ncbi:DsrE family protein [Natronomonas halophila]|uniref:DsrE family protein n=1 Tax=Natronomonas halophila TaxID=2747817 RepID=UPI0015B755D5|nr:DsrE family protein [Natronomonas halophila]QLD86597.1 DsrE family protein [Natronomonas halophila]
MTEKTVFHLPEGDESYGKRVFRNAANLLADTTVDSTVAVVVNGGGIEHVLTDAPAAEQARQLLDAGVELCVCQNTLEGTDYAVADLLDGVRIVSSAMAELTRKQNDGYAYIRP